MVCLVVLYSLKDLGEDDAGNAEVFVAGDEFMEDALTLPISVPI